MAIEWCGIMAFMYDTSSTVAWLRTSHGDTANTATHATTMAAFAVLFGDQSKRGR